MENNEQEAGVVIVYKDGTHKQVAKTEAWEYENDPDWLVTIQTAEPMAALVKAREALMNIAEGTGAFHHDPIKHAENVIQRSIDLAHEALTDIEAAIGAKDV